MRRARHGLVLARPYRFVSVVSNNLFIKSHARARHFACSWGKTADPHRTWRAPCWRAMPMCANARGGEHFRAGRFSEAVKCYSGAIEADSAPSELAKLLANRSAAYGRLGNLEAALADGKRAVEIDPSYIKGYFRATKAHMALGQFRRASAVASEGLSRAPDNEELQRALQDANSEGANSPAPPSGRRAKRASTPASPPSTITPEVPAPAARTEGSPRRASGAHGAAGPPIAITAEPEAVELKARLADAETRAEERVP